MDETQAWRTEMERQINSLWDRLEEMEQQLAYMTNDANPPNEYTLEDEELDFGDADLGDDDYDMGAPPDIADDDFLNELAAPTLDDFDDTFLGEEPEDAVLDTKN